MIALIGLDFPYCCVLCEENNVVSKYALKSSRNLFNRGNDYVYEVKKKIADRPLWKHIINKHGGNMIVPMFEHFKTRPGDLVMPDQIG